jgi:ribosomal protein S18 acetylase RimI-like enzyme
MRATINLATEAELADFLRAGDRDFANALSERVEIGAYARKIFCHAVRFEAWKESTLVGLVAAYCNDKELRTAYITTVSVRSEWRKRGVASQLLDCCIRYARESGMKEIRLEVATESVGAAKLYRKVGFTDVCSAQSLTTSQMFLNLEQFHDEQTRL